MALTSCFLRLSNGKVTHGGVQLSPTGVRERTGCITPLPVFSAQERGLHFAASSPDRRSRTLAVNRITCANVRRTFWGGGGSGEICVTLDDSLCDIIGSKSGKTEPGARPWCHSLYHSSSQTLYFLSLSVLSHSVISRWPPAIRLFFSVYLYMNDSPLSLSAEASHLYSFTFTVIRSNFKSWSHMSLNT